MYTAIHNLVEQLSDIAANHTCSNTGLLHDLCWQQQMSIHAEQVNLASSMLYLAALIVIALILMIVIALILLAMFIHHS